jgi:hypothetical protein
MAMARVKAARRTTASKRATRSRRDLTALETAFDSTPRGKRARSTIVILQCRLQGGLDEPVRRIYWALAEAVNEKHALFADASTSCDHLHARHFERLDNAFNHTATAKRLRRRIVALQTRLKRRLDGSSWAIYLALEELLNERQAGFLAYLCKYCDGTRERTNRRVNTTKR